MRPRPPVKVEIAAGRSCVKTVPKSSEMDTLTMPRLRL